MTASAGLRVALLAGVALIGVAVALAASQHHTTKNDLPAPAGQWYTALAAPYQAPGHKQKSACGVRIGPRTAGVAHPVLPCGAKIYVEFDGRQVLTQVIDRGRAASGRSFEVTQALAKMLGLNGLQTIRWRFAT